MAFQDRITLAFETEAARRAASGERRLTKTELWKAVGATSAAATHWFNGANGMDLASCVKAAPVLNVNAQWLFDGTSPMQPRSDAPETDSHQDVLPPAPRRREVEIPQFETGGAMGNGLELRDQPGIIQAWHVSAEWLNKNVPAYSTKSNLCIVTGFGDSMRPLFNPGDPLIVDRGVNSVEFDAVYFFRVHNQGYIKRLQTIPVANGMIIRAKSENSKYDSWDITPDMDFEVFGRVLKVWCSHDF
ncbi:S24 family peptidase [Achromobacter xylosoxidans]